MFEAGLDLNVASSILGSSNRTAGVANEHGQTRFCANHGASAADHVSPLRRSPRGGTQAQALHLLRPVAVHCFRAANLSGKPVRYRSLSAQSDSQALPHGFLQHGSEEHAGQRQSGSRLPHQCRLRAKPDYHRAQVLR